MVDFSPKRLDGRYICGSHTQFALSNVVLIHCAVKYKFFLLFLFSFSNELERVAWVNELQFLFALLERIHIMEITVHTLFSDLLDGLSFSFC